MDSYFLSIQSNGGMMKKLLVFLCSVLLVFGMVGMAEADNIALYEGVTAEASSYWDISVSPDKAIDGDYDTSWNAGPGTGNDWITIYLDAVYDIDQVNISYDSSERNGRTISDSLSVNDIEVASWTAGPAILQHYLESVI